MKHTENKNRKKLVVLLAMSAFAFAVTRGTLAYFTDTKSISNEFTSGSVEIKLEESVVIQDVDAYGNNKWSLDPNEKTEEGNKYELVYPGAVLPKDPTITNLGDNAANIRVKVVIENWEEWKTALDMEDAGGTDGTFANMIFANINDDFKFTEGIIVDEKLTCVYIYDEVLVTEGTTPPVFTAINIPTSLTEKDVEALNGTVTVIADAIQAVEAFTIENMWSKYDAQNQ
jgi:SipW-cognate class signal peptide